ncbi:hypothetical protein UNSWDHB_123 [Dehalobacter sp. UNSWDHB]|jgi:hypothetical protein|uniref:LiaI-LiaF-like domain-containing protein n=1 Tax=unclassified Dehalobacter TaxID=2635733 RepID=UPI00028AA62A|nr:MULTISPECIES: DUF5668 domain-containing protein [unclassified Dehalobacter]AFV02863.1 hypothetical protein DHBDCA_p1837 [Dehalobacter sp. DCA]AFV05850.1 hypothetical protein DCF50_p1848 [Dehalobacter sp. CF]EQB22609.1 hypothetical protein UNSWDHB_123 [Dehalobacter sp. UNSWDHB]
MKKNITLGAVIILVGVIWLLSNLDVFSFSIIGTFFLSLWKLWPLLLIGAGVSLLINKNSMMKMIVWIIIVICIMFYGIYGMNNSTLNYPEFKLQEHLY